MGGWIRETLTLLHQTAYKNEEAHKEKSKAAYDLITKLRSFEPSDMVLCHTPGLTRKLHSISEGPYEVLAKLLDCNYKIALPEKRSQHLVVHGNCL